MKSGFVTATVLTLSSVQVAHVEVGDPDEQEI